MRSMKEGNVVELSSDSEEKMHESNFLSKPKTTAEKLSPRSEKAKRFRHLGPRDAEDTTRTDSLRIKTRAPKKVKVGHNKTTAESPPKQKSIETVISEEATADDLASPLKALDETRSQMVMLLACKDELEAIKKKRAEETEMACTEMAVLDMQLNEKVKRLEEANKKEQELKDMITVR